MYEDDLLEQIPDYEIIKYVRDNFDFDDVFDVDYLDDWAIDNGYVHRDYIDLENIEPVLEQEGLTLGPDARMIDSYHDDNDHSGAVAWCQHPFCKGEY